MVQACFRNAVQPASTQLRLEEGLNNTATREPERPRAETTSRKNTEHLVSGANLTSTAELGSVFGASGPKCKTCIVTLRVLRVVTRCGSA